MKYSEKDFRFLCNLLQRAAAKWRKIGLQLGLDHGKLDIIQHNCPGDAERCLEEVISTWLHSDSERTSDQLDKALSHPSVGEKRLVQERKAGGCAIPEKNTYTRNTLPYLITTLYFIICLVSACILIQHLLKPGHSSSLTDKKETIIGRHKEVQDITKSLSIGDVEVFNIYGTPGFGKSTIAKHIGHTMLQKGIDVHYILVEYFQGIDALQKKLMNITENDSRLTLAQWAKNLQRQSLLILDNVDGSYWIQTKMRQNLKSKFINVLRSNSRKLKILITSQKQILAKEMYQYCKLPTMSKKDCIILLQSSATDANISDEDANTICELVGSIPFVIKILAPVLRPPDGYQTDYVIERLKSTSNLQFIANEGNRVGIDSFFPALELSFQSIRKECYIFSLLLMRQDVILLCEDDTEAIVAKEVIKQYGDANFHIEDCENQLSTSSLSEITFSYYKRYKQICYDFHTIVRSYLNNKMVNDATLLELLWNQYFESFHQNSRSHEEPGYSTRFNEEDVEVLTNLIKYTNYVNISVHLLDNSSFTCERCPYQKLQSMALRKTYPIPKKMKDAFLVCIALDSNWKYLDCKIKAAAATDALNCSKVYENTTIQLTGHNKPSIFVHRIFCKVINKKEYTCRKHGVDLLS